MTGERDPVNQHDEERGAGRAPAPQYVTHIDTVRGSTINIGSLVQGAPAPPAPGDAPDDAGYNVAAIRRLLLEAFTAQDLPRFCRDRPRLRPIVYRFGPNHGLDDMVDEVILYCGTHFMWAELLAAVQEANPDQYARFEAELHTRPDDRGATRSPVELLAPTMLDDLQQRVRDYAPATRREEAMRQVAALRAAVAGPALDLARVEAVWRWFDAELPALSGTLLSLLLHLGRQLQAGPDPDLWTEFRDRFAAYLD